MATPLKMEGKKPEKAHTEQERIIAINSKTHWGPIPKQVAGQQIIKKGKEVGSNIPNGKLSSCSSPYSLEPAMVHFRAVSDLSCRISS